jgi:hypothetical protein
LAVYIQTNVALLSPCSPVANFVARDGTGNRSRVRGDGVKLRDPADWRDKLGGGKLDESGLMDGSNIIELFVLFSDETSDGLGVTFDRLCLPTHALTAPTSSIEQKFEGALELLPC